MLEKSIFNLKKIFLVLGTACNFNCIYCVQHENKPRCKKQIKPEVMDWLDDISYQLPKRFKPTIHFYGGEPLLYKEAIHQVIDRFGDQFNYEIVSNGSHLTDEDVDYFNEHDVSFVLSNDGPNTIVTRQVDMWKDDAFVARFNRLEKRGVDAVYSAQTQDLYQLFDYIAKKSPDTPVWHEDLICNSYTDERLVNFDVSTLLASYKRMGEEFELATGLEETKLTQGALTFNRWLNSAIRSIKKPVFPQFGVCGSGKNTLTVDTEGNIYLCKNFNRKIGTVADDYDTLYEAAKELTKQLRDRNLEAKGCFDCPAFFFCKGGCPFEEASEMQKKKCVMLKTKWASVVSFIDNRLEVVQK